MTEGNVTASFGSYGVDATHRVRSQIPSILDIKVLPRQLGFKYSVKPEFWVQAPSDWVSIPRVLAEHSARLRDKFMFILVGIDDNKKTLELDQLRMKKDHYEHDLYEVARKLDVDVADRLLRSLSEKDYWRFERSGLGGRNANSRYTRKRTHSWAQLPVAAIDGLLCGYTDIVQLDDTIRYSDASMVPYFTDMIRVHSWIKSVNPRFVLMPPKLEDEESNYYFPWVPFTLDYDKLMTMSEDFSIYIMSKIQGLVDTKVMLESRSASDAGRNISKTLRQDNRTDGFTRDLPTKMNVSKAGRLMKALFTAGLHSHLVVEYLPQNFDSPDAATLLDCLLLPLTGPARFYTTATLRQCFNYLVKHIFSKVKNFTRTPPTVNEYAKDNQTPLMEWLRREGRGRGRVAILADAAFRYFTSFTDGEGIPSGVAENYVVGQRDNGWPIIADANGLPFHVAKSTVFKSFFPNNPHDRGTMDQNPDIWNLFTAFANAMDAVLFSDSKNIIKDVKRLMLDLSDKGGSYIEYAYRIMSEYEKLFLYPLAYAGAAEITEHRKMVMTVESGAIMSFVSVVDWGATKIEVTGTDFIQDGITDIWALHDVFQSYTDSQYALDFFIQRTFDETGMDTKAKIGRSEFIKMSPMFEMHKSSKHAMIRGMFDTVDSKVLRDYLLTRNVSDSIGRYVSYTDELSHLWHYTWNIFHKTGSVDRGASADLGIDMFSLSSLVPSTARNAHETNAQRVIMSTELQFSTVVPMAANVFEFKYPLMEHAFQLRELANFLRDKSVFKVFATISDSDSSRRMDWDNFMNQYQNNHFIRSVPVGWDWFFDETFNIFQRMYDLDLVASDNVGQWFHAFVRFDSTVIQQTQYDADDILLTGVGRFLPGTVGAVDPRDILSRPFINTRVVSINTYKVTPFPELTLTQTRM